MSKMIDIDNVITGHVKWFDPGKGFGFIVSDAGGPDILLHANVLRNFGQGSIADGAEITVAVQNTERGVQATEVLKITAPSFADSFGSLSDLSNLDPEEIANTPLEPARVKWFDKSKGFGFANVFGSTQDVFVHIEVLRHSGLADLQPGEAICLRSINGDRGRMAVEVLVWESAIKS